MSPTLGEKLRQAREERGISVSEVAEQTRISSLYLKSIEEDNYKPLPGGIFNKGFVKAYAKYVGIDEQEALQDYARLVAQNEPDSGPDNSSPRYRPEVLTDEARSASSLVPTVVFAGIILALMTGGILFVVSYIQNRPDTTPAANNTVATNTNGPADTTQADANTALPATSGELRLEFRALSEKVSVTSTVDGNLGYDEVSPEAVKTYNAQQGIKLRYYRGFADKVQLSLNGKPLTAPPPPAKGNIEFEITRENAARILQTGQIVDAAAAGTSAPATPAPVTANTSAPSDTPVANTTARPTPTPPRPAFTPQPTPRRSPTPIVVGSPRTRPSPE
ncbi:MAG TPA: helix-turn-helix domain-containing protein [Pyrinomonadaceae bacterium]|nr:helix-turn-helix domain-containing protein [Pyrinomonadaceae bacterium]